MSTHFRMTDLLANPTRVEAALQDGVAFRVTAAEAMLFQKHLTGAIWTAQTIRLTTDLAHIMAKGGHVVVPAAALASFGATLVFDQGSGIGLVTGIVSTTVVVVAVAAAAVIGFAMGHLGPEARIGALMVVNDGGTVTLSAADEA